MHQSKNVSLFLLQPSEAKSNLIPPVLQQLMDSFRGMGDFLSPQHLEWLACYDRDSQQLETMIPSAVFKPSKAEVIPLFIQKCADLLLPVTPRCGGTGFSGGALASTGGIILLTGHLKEIWAYDPHLGQVWIEPGVTPKQLDRAFAHDNWSFPFAMESAGVAGIAGCLSSNARPYAMGRGRSILDLISRVVICDGNGIEREIPAHLACGSEGLLGVITKVLVKLVKRGAVDLTLTLASTWKNTRSALPSLQAYQALTSIEWYPDNDLQFILRLHGEQWRVDSSLSALNKRFGNALQVTSRSNYMSNRWSMIPHGENYYMLESTLPITHVEAGMQRVRSLCSRLGLKCNRSAQILDGRVQLLIYAKEEKREFIQKLDYFLVEWVNILEEFGGCIFGAHGVGAQLRNYLPSLYHEGEIASLHELKQQFDPKQIMANRNFFPVPGKCIERNAELRACSKSFK